MTCSRCQHESEAGAKFCPKCAHPRGLFAAPPQAPRFGSPESYAPALEGERTQG